MVYRTRETLLEYIKRDLPDGKHSLVTRNNVVLTIELYNLGDVVYVTSPVLGTDPNRMLVLKYDNLTINSGVTITPAQACKGMCIYVKGELINNGTISMTARGWTGVGQNIYLYDNEVVPAIGAGGGPSQSLAGSGIVTRPGVKGYDGAMRQSAGGGSGAGGYSGGGATTYTPGRGGNGTSYSGGTGGGAAWSHLSNMTGESGSDQGGAGGNAVSNGDRPTGGGAGNPGGDGASGGSQGNSGTGGLLIVFVNKITNNGTISSNGSNGGSGVAANGGGGGGSSGGGSVNIFYVLNIDSGSIVADGGISVNSSGAGGNGSVSLDQIPKETLLMLEQILITDINLEEALLSLSYKTGTGGELPWCSGYFQDRSLVAGVQNIMTPILDNGDPAMIVSDTFVANDDGVYVLDIGGGAIPTIANASSGIYNSTTLTSDHYLRGIFVPSIQTIPPTVLIDKLNANNILTHSLYSAAAQTTITFGGSMRNFFFARIA